MGLTHTPRVLWNIAKGYYRHRHLRNNASLDALETHVYQARAGLLDVDYLGHLNNASYLSHAELARWEWTATTGLLQIMYSHNVHFLVASSCVRYRAEVRPLFRKFNIETTLEGIDETSLWISHKFRYPPSNSSESSPNKERVRAQIVVRGVATQHRKVLDPRVLFRDYLQLDKELVESLVLSPERESSMETVLERYVDLEDALKQQAADDDQKLA